MKDHYIPDNIMARLVKVIRSITDIHSIYLIGAQQENKSSLYVLNPTIESPGEEFYVLTLIIISEKDISHPKQFMNEVYTKMDQRVKIYSIHYTLNDLKYRLNFGDNFLSRFLSSSENELYCSQRLWVCDYCYHPKMYDMIKKEWELRMNRAFYFEDKAEVHDTIDDENTRMFLLSQALQQASAALLYVFWEYKPSHFDLNQLLNLCKHFSHSPKIVLPKNSFRSQRVYSALSHAQYNLNFKSDFNVQLRDSDYAHDLCRRFLENAEIEGRRRLKELRHLHYNPKENFVFD